MNFKQFAEQLRIVDAQTTRGDRIILLSKLFSKVDDPELASVIYLCQSRLAETYLARVEGFGFRLPVSDNYHLLNAKRNCLSVDQIKNQLGGKLIPDIDKLESKDYASLNINEFYIFLNNMVDKLDSWLSCKEPVSFNLSLLFQEMGEQEREVLVRILTGPLFDDKEIISALDLVIHHSIGTIKMIKNAYSFTLPDLGVIAQILKAMDYQALIDLKPKLGIPLKPQKISVWETPEEAWNMCGGTCYVQYKYDGWELQIHKNGNDVKLFNRNLQLITTLLPDIVKACQSEIPVDKVILDCEIVGYDPVHKRILPWGNTLSAANHKVFVHNIILIDDEDWRNYPYYKSHKMMYELFGMDDSRVITMIYDELVGNFDQAANLYEQWTKQRNLDGVVFKKYAGKYKSGRTTNDQGKVKRYFSLDTVVLGYRISSKNYPSFWVGVWDEDKKRLIPIGVVEGAVISPSDRQILLGICNNIRVEEKPNNVFGGITPQVWVRPHIVIEVIVKGKSKSKKYSNLGYELYKRKGIRIRKDKGIEDVDTVEEFLNLPLPPAEIDTTILYSLILGYKKSYNGVPAFLIGLWDTAHVNLIPFGGIEGVVVQNRNWQDLLKYCQTIISPSRPPQVVSGIAPQKWVFPRIVLELRTDGVKVKSDKYNRAGFTVRRINSWRVRNDLVPNDAHDIQKLLEFPLFSI